MQASGDDTTGAYRIKVLALYLAKNGGGTALAEFHERVGESALLDDETAPVPRWLWVRALLVFERLAGTVGLRKLGPSFLESDVVGVWAEVLRGAGTPAEIFSGAVTGQYLPGIPAWSDFRFENGAWVGEVASAPSDSETERRLMAEALRSEAETLPALVGYGARAELSLSQGAYRVRVKVVEPGFSLGFAPIAGALAAAIPFAIAAFEGTPAFSQARVVASAILAASVTFAASTFLRWDGRQRRVSRAQRMRISALERESFVRRRGPSDVSRPHGEPALAGQYRIGVQLGVGGSGAVWHATRIRDAKPVALKLIRTGVAHDVRATDRLRREAEALGLAWHPNVVEIYDTGVLPSGVAYLAMERLYGESVAERILRTRTLPYREVRAIGLELAEALIAIHSAGLVHRDIKPSNLFLHTENTASDGSPRETLKLIDFGVARIVWAETRLTRPGVRIGTFGYAAPEQERGDDVDGRADLYGAGITLLECLTGVGPLRRSAPPESRIECEVPLPGEFAALIRTLTEDDPNLRPASARELRDLLLALPLEPAHPELGQTAG